MKRIISVLLIVLTAMLLLSGCMAKTDKSVKTDDRISVVATIFPEYDWVREIAKGNDNVEITMLLDKGVDLHSFQPTADDIVKVSSCDMFIYVGGESDAWIEDALKEAANKDMVVINLLSVLGDSIKEEELVEGMQSEEEADKGALEEEPEYDEHVWLSLKNAKVLVQAISEGLCKIDPENKTMYETNAKAYATELDELDKDYEVTVNNASVKTLLFGDRFPFRYMVDDYGLDYYAAFAGCSAESEASFETITFLAGKLDELGLNSIIQIESSDGRIAQTIIDTTNAKNQQILTMDSMQSVTSKDVEDGATYLGIMKDNLDVLGQALE